MRTGLILDWRRTRQQVVQQKFALRVKARFNPFRDSAGCTIAMRWQRRLKSNSSEDQTLFLKPGQGTVHIFWEHPSPGDESACHPNRSTYVKWKEILLIPAQRFGERQPSVPPEDGARTIFFQGKNHIDRRVDLNWLAVPGCGSVAPRANRVQSGLKPVPQGDLAWLDSSCSFAFLDSRHLCLPKTRSG